MGNEVIEGIVHEAEEKIQNFAKEIKYQNNPVCKKCLTFAY